MDTSWSLGTLVGLPFCILLALLFFVAGMVCWKKYPDFDSVDSPMIKWGGRILWALALVTVVWTALGMYPFKAEYHQWQPVGGTVTKVDKRLVSSGEGMQEKIVVVFEGNSDQFGCSDTRCASVKPGDELGLKCKRAFEWAAVDGYDCRFVYYKDHS